jgi:hypothetical protein
MLPHVRIEQLGCANVLSRIIDAEHGLVREAEDRRSHKSARITAHVEDRVSFDEPEHRSVPLEEWELRVRCDAPIGAARFALGRV